MGLFSYSTVLCYHIKLSIEIGPSDQDFCAAVGLIAQKSDLQHKKVLTATATQRILRGKENTPNADIEMV